MYQLCDIDGSGDITLSEFVAAVRGMGGKLLSDGLQDKVAEDSLLRVPRNDPTVSGTCHAYIHPSPRNKECGPASQTEYHPTAAGNRHSDIHPQKDKERGAASIFYPKDFDALDLDENEERIVAPRRSAYVRNHASPSQKNLSPLFLISISDDERSWVDLQC